LFHKTSVFLLLLHPIRRPSRKNHQPLISQVLFFQPVEKNSFTKSKFTLSCPLPFFYSNRPRQMKIGYARVSTRDQNLDLQIDALKKAGCAETYISKEQITAATQKIWQANHCSMHSRKGGAAPPHPLTSPKSFLLKSKMPQNTPARRPTSCCSGWSGPGCQRRPPAETGC